MYLTKLQSAVSLGEGEDAMNRVSTIGVFVGLFFQIGRFWNLHEPNPGVFVSLL
ncbi:MAG: hypothetical protein RM338_29090 [Nostoc sp. DedQUE12a]|nr:hypothetical protein [Nostoc sp. DedQUE12a]